MLVGPQLLAVASTLTGATRLQRSVMGASRAADGTGDYDLFAVLTHRFKVGILLLFLWRLLSVYMSTSHHDRQSVPSAAFLYKYILYLDICIFTPVYIHNFI